VALSADQQAQVDQLKKLLGAAVGNYTDDQLWALIVAAGGSLNSVAGDIWGEYAASTATLIDMKEGSSTRNLGDLYDQALKMSAHFKNLADGDLLPIVRPSRTRAIERP